MSLHKLIFRLDMAKTCYDLIDRPGRILAIFDEMGDEFWSEFKDSVREQQKLAIFSSGYPSTEFRQLAVSPSAITVSMQDAKGIALERLYSHDVYTTLFKGVQAFCDEFRIREIRRAGIRFHTLRTVGSSEVNLTNTFSKMLDQGLLGIVNQNLGAADDYALTLTGQHRDETRYRLHVGPYAADEAPKFFEHVSKVMAESISANFISDLDIYESDFVLKESAMHWTKPLIAKAQTSINAIEQLLAKQLDGAKNG